MAMRPAAVSMPADRAGNDISVNNAEDKPEQAASDGMPAGYWTPQEQPAKPKTLMERIAGKKAQIEMKEKGGERLGATERRLLRYGDRSRFVGDGAHPPAAGRGASVR